MSIHTFIIVVVLLPAGLRAQAPIHTAAGPVPNATTRAVLLINRPAHLAEEQWLHMMQAPVNQSLYPLRVTQAMLDTLDPTALDPRFRYVLVPTRSIGAR
jgi:hypothetical protein